MNVHLSPKPAETDELDESDESDENATTDGNGENGAKIAHFTPKTTSRINGEDQTFFPHQKTSS